MSDVKHLVAEVRFFHRDSEPTRLVCTCGERFETELSMDMIETFRAHRLANGQRMTKAGYSIAPPPKRVTGYRKKKGE